MPYPYVSMNRCYDNRLQSLPSAVRNTTENLFSLPTKKGSESNDSAPFSRRPRLPYTRNDAFALGIATFYSPIHYADIHMPFV